MRKHFITFGDSGKYQDSLVRIENEVVETNFFNSVMVCNEYSIPEFFDYHREFVTRSKKGFGYWIWKSYLVGRHLETMSDGDILLYSDCGCQLNANSASIGRLGQYFEMLGDSPLSTLSFELTHKERTWTKRDCFDHFQAAVDDSNQLMATAFLIKRSPDGLRLIEGITDLVQRKVYSLFDDTASVAINDPSFIEHRHDQSIFSLARKLAGTLIVPDETWFKNWDDGRNFPIHARRFV